MELDIDGYEADLFDKNFVHRKSIPPQKTWNIKLLLALS